MNKTDFLRLSYYLIAIILFVNILLLNRNIIYLQTHAPSKDVLATKVSETSDTLSTIREQHIVFGSGSSDDNAWTDVSGLLLTLDSQNYKNAKKMIFETTFQIPTGNGRAYVRLYNVTDKVPVWPSEVSSEGPAGTVFYMTSPSFVLASGSKLYQVQMKNSLRYTTLLLSSRIRVTY